MKRGFWLVLVVLAAGAGGAAYYYLGHGKEMVRDVATGVTVRSALEKTATQAVQTDVDVTGVDVALETGEGTVKTLRVDNPPGFAKAPAMTLGAVQFELDRSTLEGTGPLIIRSLSINAAEIRYERDETGHSNLNALAGSVAAAAEKALAATDAKAAGRLVMIDNLYVRNITLKIGDAAEGTELKRLHLSNIGRAENGVKPTAAAQTIITAIAKAADAAATEIVATQ